MNLSISRLELCTYFTSQLNNFFPDSNPIKASDLSSIIDTAIDRLDFCFRHASFSRYNKNGESIYNHLYADHNIVFTWLLSNTAYKISANENLATKLYYLNKTLHSFDCMYDTGLPDIFLIFHGSGTMLGKAEYKNFFVALQGCTVGSHKGLYPRFGTGVALAANCSVVGDCTLGNRTSVSTRTLVFLKDIPPDSSVYVNQDSGKVEVKLSKECYAQQFFNIDLKRLS
jgi:serine O-acetyltransferase